MHPLKLPLLLTPLTYIHVGNPGLLPNGEKEFNYPNPTVADTLPVIAGNSV
jgi:hypothetical protein